MDDEKVCVDTRGRSVCVLCQPIFDTLRTWYEYDRYSHRRGRGDTHSDRQRRRCRASPAPDR
jgi:hypothetical protein